MSLLFVGNIRLKTGDVSGTVHDLERENDIMSLVDGSQFGAAVRCEVNWPCSSR